MKHELKTELGNKKKLQKILGCSDVHAWRLWEGKTKLTPTNEKLIRIVLASESK